MTLLKHPSISVLVGEHCPTAKGFERIAKGYANLGPKPGPYHSFKQVVFLNGTCLQIRNFLRRCHVEIQGRLRLRYCVICKFDESRDFHQLLSRILDYRLAIIVYGDGCADGVPESMGTPH